MVADELASVPRSVEDGGSFAADVDAVVVGEEAEQVEEPVGGRPGPVGSPVLADQVLLRGGSTAC